MSNIHNILMSGDNLQGVGLRKRIHRLFNKNGLKTFATNIPQTGGVEVTFKGRDREKIQKALDRIKATFKPETIKNLPYSGLERVSINDKDIEGINKRLFLTYLRSSKYDPKNQDMLSLRERKDHVLARYPLKENKTNGELTGYLPRRAKQQLLGKEPEYKFFMDKNLIRTPEEGVELIQDPKTKEVMKKFIKSLNKKSLYALNRLHKSAPYKVVKAGSKWKVKKKDDGKVMGTHSTKADAKNQIKAIYANEKSSSLESINKYASLASSIKAHTIMLKKKAGNNTSNAMGLANSLEQTIETNSVPGTEKPSDVLAEDLMLGIIPEIATDKMLLEETPDISTVPNFQPSDIQKAIITFNMAQQMPQLVPLFNEKIRRGFARESIMRSLEPLQNKHMTREEALQLLQHIGMSGLG